MAPLINLVSWENAPSNLYAYRFPETNLTTFTQLIVHESQEAVLFSKGRMIGKFGPGKWTLSTENLPILHELFGIPFGKKNPFTAEIWFVNKRIPLNLDWKISNMTVRDPEFKFVPLVASGRYGLRIDNAERFLINLVGNLPEFYANDITDHFQGLIEQNTKSAIMSYITNNGVRITELASRLNEIASSLENVMEPFWNEYGMKIAGFYVTNIGIDGEDENGKRLLEAIAAASQQSIQGYTWQQEQAMDVAKKAVSNTGDMGILGMAMFAGGFGASGSFQDTIMKPGDGRESFSGNETSQKPRRRTTVFCSNCGKSYSTESKFCPHCGNPYRPCPVCGADNSERAKRCVSCGSVLPDYSKEASSGLYCSKCGKALEAGTKFCPECGTKVE